MTHNLIVNCGLYSKMDVFRPEPATFQQMARFHSEEYLNFLREISPDTIGAHIKHLSVTTARGLRIVCVLRASAADRRAPGSAKLRPGKGAVKCDAPRDASHRMVLWFVVACGG